MGRPPRAAPAAQPVWVLQLASAALCSVSPGTAVDRYLQPLSVLFSAACSSFSSRLGKDSEGFASCVPGILRAFSVGQGMGRCRRRGRSALKYVREHGNKYREERIASGCDRLQLHTFTEAPAQILLKGHYALLRSYVWHMLTARRQQDCLKRLLGGELPKEDAVVVFDWKEKIRLPIGPAETSHMWHCQQKYAIFWRLCGQTQAKLFRSLP